MFASVDKMVKAYEANPPENETIKAYMDILMPTWKAMSEARNNGELVDEAYFKSHYQSEINQLKEKYDATSLESLMKIAEYAQTLASLSEFKQVADYFGLSTSFLG